MSRIAAVLTSLFVVCLAALIPAAAHASTTAGAVRADLAGASTPARGTYQTMKSVAGVTAAQASIHGCDPGYVCVYPGETWNEDHPSLKYYNYGWYNFSNQYGWHFIVNNQTGGANFYLCTQYGGGGCSYGPYPAVGAGDFYLTPINSIKLTP